MRSFLSCIFAIAFIGCATTKPATETKSAVSAPPSDDGGRIGQCHDGDSTEEYGCKAGDMCPNMDNDVREMEGFHVISVGTRDGSKFIHVASTCQHYFCGVNEDCLEKGGSETSCMRPTGCQLVYKLKK